MMDSAYWNHVAENYDSEIFNVCARDTAGLIRQRLDKLADPNAVANDIGCGTGNFLPDLSKRFKHVNAIDLSPRLLDKARANHGDLPNVRFMQRDLARKGTRLPKADVALCVNTLLTPSLAQRVRMLEYLGKSLNPGGHLILVVPSLESALLTNARLIEWNLRDGVAPGVANRAGFGGDVQEENRRLYEGLVALDGVLTKHYTREELAMLLSGQGLSVVETVKLEYPWGTEFEDAPGWMGEPYPWDWLCVTHIGKTNKIKPPQNS